MLIILQFHSMPSAAKNRPLVTAEKNLHNQLQLLLKYAKNGKRRVVLPYSNVMVVWGNAQQGPLCHEE